MSAILCSAGWWSLFIHVFHICEFTYLLKFICNFKSVLTVILKSSAPLDMDRAVKNWSLLCHIFTVEAEEADFLLKLSTANKSFVWLHIVFLFVCCFVSLSWGFSSFQDWTSLGWRLWSNHGWGNLMPCSFAFLYFCWLFHCIVFWS